MPRVNYFSPPFFFSSLLCFRQNMYRVFDFSFFFKESIVRVIFGYYKRRILEEEDITRYKCEYVSLNNFDK